MEKFKSAEYNIVYNFETIKELIDNKKEDTTFELEDHSSSSSSSSSSTPIKSTEKISHIVLLSSACAAKTKSGIKTGYCDRRDGSEFHH
jgi:DNA phosphorothioation-dependent restriction protein DptG